jgi:lipopolysaccharide transport protein LptA
MASLLIDGAIRRVALALLASLGCAFAAWSAETAGTDIEVEGSNPMVNLNAGTLMMRDVSLRQGPGTLIRAKQTSARGLTEGYENSEWEFKGEVHIEFDGAVLDADSAIARFSDNKIRQIHVVGEPARFSHQLKNSAQRNQGRAGTVDYDATTALVRFAGGTWYSDGRNEVNTSALVYNLNDGSFSNESTATDPGRVRLTIRPGKRIAPPRTPERSTAQ